ncbi:MAG: hypothetical protein MJZ63_07550 [Muribaculaceae bacterium]|nr:hypothetical protein [Muribaculaceae bacterium]
MKKILFALLVAASLPFAAWSQAPTDSSVMQAIDSTENKAITNMNEDVSAEIAKPTVQPDDKSNLPILAASAALLIALLAIIYAHFVKRDAIKKQTEKDHEFEAFKTALQKRNEEFDQQLRLAEARIAALEDAKDRATRVAPQQMSVPRTTSAQPQKAAAPSKVFLSRPDDSGYFMAASTHMEPGNSIFVLTTADGNTGTFEVISDAGVHQLALMMPTENLTRACTGRDIQISAGKTRIVTDAPGRAVKEGRQWKITTQATIHYE